MVEQQRGGGELTQWFRQGGTVGWRPPPPVGFLRKKSKETGKESEGREKDSI